MPYKSNKQRRFFHTEAANKAGITAAEVKEFDKESKNMKLVDAIRKKKEKEYRKKLWRGGSISDNDLLPGEVNEDPEVADQRKKELADQAKLSVSNYVGDMVSPERKYSKGGEVKDLVEDEEDDKDNKKKRFADLLRMRRR